MSNYTQTYEAADTSKVTIDLIVGIGGVIFSFVTLIGLILVYKFIKSGKVKI